MSRFQRIGFIVLCRMKWMLEHIFRSADLLNGPFYPYKYDVDSKHLYVRFFKKIRPFSVFQAVLGVIALLMSVFSSVSVWKTHYYPRDGISVWPVNKCHIRESLCVLLHAFQLAPGEDDSGMRCDSNLFRLLLQESHHLYPGSRYL